MAIAFRSASSAGNNGSASLVFPAPAGLADNDILLAVVAAWNEGAVTAPSGWTQLDNIAGNYGDVTIFWKRASSESGTYTFSFANLASNGGVLAVFLGCTASGSPVDVEGGQASSADSLSVAAPSITTAASNEMLVYLAAVSAYNTSTSWTAPSGMTLAANTGYSGDTTYRAAHISYTLQAATGATGTKTGTMSAIVSGANAVAFLVGLKPAVPITLAIPGLFDREAVRGALFDDAGFG